MSFRAKHAEKLSFNLMAG